MKGSLERVRKLLAGEKPDRMPHFDLLPNDAVLAHFSDGVPVAIGDDDAGRRALARATDASRWCYFSPKEDAVEVLPDGRRKIHGRYTTWDDPKKPVPPDQYAREAAAALRDMQEALKAPYDTAGHWQYLDDMQSRNVVGEDFYWVALGASPQLMGTWLEYGLEAFCDYIYECDEAVGMRLEANTLEAIAWVDALPADTPFEMFFAGEDIAFNNAPMFSPRWLDRQYFPRLKRIIDRFHARGKSMLFHSDGDLNLLMDGLVAAGIDALNPIDVNAGMDLKVLHRRYPNLVFAGGIDVARLLPFGTKAEIRDAVVRAIEDTEGRIMVGSSTEVGNSVPLENYLAMREAVMSYRL